jgi:cephalosporin hydroxylase
MAPDLAGFAARPALASARNIRHRAAIGHFMSGITTYFRDFPGRTDDRRLFKMDHYLGVYDRELAAWQGSRVSFLEIGIFKGGSLRMWQNFFAPGSALTFLDIDPACKALEMPGIDIRIGDQTDVAFLSATAQARGPFDMIVDEGGHKMDQQITSFSVLWPHLKDGGLYIVEDTHTSYWPGFGGGHKAPGSFIEFAKDLIDKMHSWYTDDDAGFPLHPLAAQIGGIQFYDSMVIVRKELKQPPVSITAQNGQVAASDDILKVRGRVSIF